MPQKSIPDPTHVWSHETSLNRAIALALLHADWDADTSLKLLQTLDMDGACSPTRALHKSAVRAVKARRKGQPYIPGWAA